MQQQGLLSCTAVMATCGTPWQLRAAGSIVLLEEVGEPAYRLDRLVQQLRDAGVLDGVVGVGVGELRSCRVPPDADWTAADLMREHLVGLGVPVLMDLPFGHGPANHAWVHGARGTIEDGALRWRGGLV